MSVSRCAACVGVGKVHCLGCELGDPDHDCPDDAAELACVSCGSRRVSNNSPLSYECHECGALNVVCRGASAA